jgi:PPOX class probable F420-dependent enzyme
MIERPVRSGLAAFSCPLIASVVNKSNNIKGGTMAEGDKADRLSEEIRALIRGANFGHLATLMRDGAPHIDPVWIDLEGDTILVCSGAGSLKAKNTKRDPRIGLCVIAMDNPYKETQLRGRVVEQRPDSDFTVIDRVSRKYTGKPFPFREKPAERVVLVIAVERARYLALPFIHAPA